MSDAAVDAIAQIHIEAYKLFAHVYKDMVKEKTLQEISETLSLMTDSSPPKIED